MVQKEALTVLKRYFGYTSFRPGQEDVVEALLNNKDCMAIMPTGAGKSICFQVPALLKSGLTIVFTPLISLMKDQVDGLRLQQIPATSLNSSLTSEEFNKRLYEVRSGRIKLLYLAPERLELEWFCNILRSLPISQIIIDEAHCVSQWGHDFRPSYKNIAPFVKTLPYKPTVAAFTATATAEVECDMKTLLALEQATVFVTGFDRPNLYFAVEHVSNRMHYVLTFVQSHVGKTGIIYCITRKDVELVYEMLIKSGVKAGYYHAGLPDDVRKKQQELYAYDKIDVIVATNAFGMGIDKSNVRYVIHYQMPRNMESYYQEAGRAGRDGGQSECILLYNGRDVMIHKFLIDQSIHDLQRKHIELTHLKQMTDYCFGATCLRHYILRYFGETQLGWTQCDNCSACHKSGQRVNLTREAKAIFHAIAGTDERFGLTMIASIVAGDKTERIIKQRFDQLPIFGALSDMDDREIKGLIKQLIATGYIASSVGKYPILSLNVAAEEVLAGLGEVEQIRPTVVAKKTAPFKDSGNTRVIGSAKSNLLTNNHMSLFEHLRAHRKQLATEAGVPPYLIFPDTVLIDMASMKPSTLADMYTIKGIGEVKLKKYGMSFLKALGNYKD